MSTTIELPSQYGLVLLAATSTFFIQTVHFVLTGHTRAASGIKYPNAYATDEQAKKDPKAARFNCAQRANANFTENHTSFLGALLIGGLRFPFLAACLGATWTVARIWYAFGYTGSAGPKGRSVPASLGLAVDLIMKGMAGWSAVTFALSQ